MRAVGRSKREISKSFGISIPTLDKWLETEAANRFQRSTNRELAMEEIIGTVEGVITSAWESYNQVTNPNSLAAPNYLRTILDAAREIARLRGLDRSVDTQQRKISVQISIGKPDQDILDIEAFDADS